MVAAARLHFFFVFSPEPQAVELNHTQGEASTSINPFQTHRPEGSQDLIKLPTNINHQRTLFSLRDFKDSLMLLVGKLVSTK